MKHYRITAAFVAGMALFASSAFAAESSHGGTLQVKVDGLTSSQPVYFGLWEAKAGFLASKPLKGEKVTVADGEADWTIDNLPYGYYAVSAWQDINGNGKMDTNSYGAPVEPTGFSNNAKGHFGPPSWDDAKIELNQPAMQVTFQLACPMGCVNN